MKIWIFETTISYFTHFFDLNHQRTCLDWYTQPVRTLFLFKFIWIRPQGSQGCQKIRIFLQIKLLDLFYLIKYKNLVKLYIFHWFDEHIPCSSLTQSAATLLLHDLKSMSLPLCGGWWFRKCNWCNENILTSWKVGSSEKPNRKKTITDPITEIGVAYNFGQCSIFWYSFSIKRYKWNLKWHEKLKSVNVQYNTLGQWDDGPNESSTKRLMFQVHIIFFMSSCKTLGKILSIYFLLFHKITNMKIKSFECPKSIKSL